MKQEVQKTYHDQGKRTSVPTFRQGEIVRVKNFREGFENYVKGVIAKTVGPYRYVVKIGNRCRYVHVEHLHKTEELNLDVSQEFTHARPEDIINVDIPSTRPTVPTAECSEETGSLPVTHRATPRKSVAVSKETVASPKSTEVKRYSLRASVKPPDRLIEKM